MKLARLFAALGAAGFVVSAPASADVVCTFNVDAVSIDSWGSLVLQLDENGTPYSWWYCNTVSSVTANNGYNSITVQPATCQAIYTQFLTARTTGKPISMQFHGPSDCSQASLPVGGFPSLYPVTFTL